MTRQIGILTVDGYKSVVEEATCRFRDGLLSLSLRGGGWELHLPLMPFQQAASVAELAGQSWRPTTADLNASETLNEGGYIVFNDREFVPREFSIHCRSVDESARWATIEFVSSGCFDGDELFLDLTGFADCRVESPPCSYCGEPLRSAKALQCFACGAVWR